MHYELWILAVLLLVLLTILIVFLALNLRRKPSNAGSVSEMFRELLLESQMRETRLLNLLVSKDLPTFQTLQTSLISNGSVNKAAPALPVMSDTEEAFNWAERTGIPVGALSDSADGDLTQFESDELRRAIFGDAGETGR